jgi:HSP20 family protein
MEESMANVLGDVGISPIATRTSIEVNIKEHADKFEVFAKVPGFQKDEINIGFEDNMLIIEVARSSENEEKESNNYYMREFVSENYRRAISLPSKIDTDKAEAELKNGIMKITLPKMPEVLPKKIHIKD